MSYIGNTLENQNYVPAVDFLNGDGSTVTFTLSRPVASVAQVQAVISNVPQNPGSAFTVSGSTITFTSAPPSGTGNIYVYYTSPNTQVVQPGQGTVGATQIDGSYALWNKSGSDVNYTAGNVGIGTSSPTQKLDVYVPSGGAYAAVRSAASGVNVGVLLSQGNNTFYNIVNAAGWQVYDGVNGATRLRIDSSGRVTTPYQPAFFAYKDNFSYSPTIWQAISSYDGQSGSSNRNSNFSTSTGRFTCPVDGVYHFDCIARSIDGASNNQISGVQLWVNGSAYYGNDQWASSGASYGGTIRATCAASFTIALSANDYVQFGITGSIYHAYFSGALLG
jgi:hypothetical protein